MRPLQWRLKDYWSPMVDNPAVQIPLLLECVEAVCSGLQEDRWVFGVPLQVPPPSLLLHTVRLGSPPVRSYGFGNVVPGGEFSAHQKCGMWGKSKSAYLTFYESTLIDSMNWT